MPLEIERKFLLNSDAWCDQADAGSSMQQGYLATTATSTVRIRLTDNRAWLTIKGRTQGISRPEFEYEIPTIDAVELLPLCEPTIIQKTRYRVDHHSHTWEIDVFAAANAPLILAEIELPHEDTKFDLPTWIGQEVTHDPRYRNSHLARHPFSTW